MGKGGEPRACCKGGLHPHMLRPIRLGVALNKGSGYEVLTSSCRVSRSGALNGSGPSVTSAGQTAKGWKVGCQGCQREQMQPSRQWVNCWSGEERRALTGGGHRGRLWGPDHRMCRWAMVSLHWQKGWWSVFRPWEFVDMADLRPAQWQEVLDPELDPRCYEILPGLEVAQAKKKTSGGYPHIVHVLHNLHCHGRD